MTCVTCCSNIPACQKRAAVFLAHSCCLLVPADIRQVSLSSPNNSPAADIPPVSDPRERSRRDAARNPCVCSLGVRVRVATGPPHTLAHHTVQFKPLLSSSLSDEAAHGANSPPCGIKKPETERPGSGHKADTNVETSLGVQHSEVQQEVGVIWSYPRGVCPDPPAPRQLSL